MRYFAAASGDVYEQARLALDAAWGLPNDKGTATCIPPLAIAPRDATGRPLVAVRSEWCDWEPARSLLPELITNGLAFEISQPEYLAAANPPSE